MSRISDFDAFLKAQQVTDEAAYSKRQQRLQAARQEFDEVLKQIFRAVKEYHETILLPRQELLLVLKKEEAVGSRPDEPYTFRYRANIIPTDFLPPAFRQTSLMERVDYLKPGEITPYDWHANVAMQLSTSLEETPGAIHLLTEIKTWGHLKPEGQAPLAKQVTISHETDKRTPYTVLSVHSREFEQDAFLKEIENLLMIVTPFVLAHRRIVWKKEDHS